jgi:peptidyl-prolyl cis-trans isomerase A (cyclophilin A)
MRKSGRSGLDTLRTWHKSVPMIAARRLLKTLAVTCMIAAGCAVASKSSLLLKPDARQMNRRAPNIFNVRLETSKGDIVIEVRRDWAPHGADRFYNLVAASYYDEGRFFRVIQGRWVQFGINGNPQIANLWRRNFIPDDPAGQSNIRGTVAFAFAVPNGRTTQVFINLQDNSATHDREPFVPFGKVIAGMDVADALSGEYGESAGGGIRGGKQDPIFQGGNTYLKEHFPHLDFIKRAVVVK